MKQQRYRMALEAIQQVENIGYAHKIAEVALKGADAADAAAAAAAAEVALDGAGVSSQNFANVAARFVELGFSQGVADEAAEEMVRERLAVGVPITAQGLADLVSDGPSEALLSAFAWGPSLRGYQHWSDMHTLAQEVLDPEWKKRP